LFLGEFGGTITEFCFLTMPLIFFPFSKRPLLIAVSGLIAHNLLASAISWTQDLWLPDVFLGEQISRPLIVFGVVCIILLFPLVFSLWEKQRDATLMAALLGFKIQAEEKTDPISPESLSYESMPGNAASNGTYPEVNDWTASLDLMEQEHNIALMLCDGMSRTDIEKKLNLPAAQISAHLRKIRTKLSEQTPIGRSPYVQKAVSRYGLTAREAEVFHEMVLGRSNMEICSNLYIEESTVKSHVNRILKKTGASNRAELIARLQKEEIETPLLQK
jgi:DNA-binding NarL/FixJ family response regulator